MALDSLNKITIDVSDPLNTPVVRAVQEDIRSRFVEITLVRNGQPLDIPAGAYGMIGIRRPDGTYCLYDETEDETSAITISDNVVTVYLSQEALAVAGRMYTSVSLYSADGKIRLTAFAFTVAVEPTAVPSGAVPSTYINILQGLVEDAVDAATRAEQAAAQVGDPVAYTAQTRTPTEQAQARANIGAMASDAHPTPAAHASTHATGGSDAITPTSIGAMAADATPTPAAHASTHSMGGSDAITPADIGAMRVYISVTELGLTVGSATLNGVVSAMPIDSIFMGGNSNFTPSELPFTDWHGIIRIQKRNGWLISAQAYGYDLSYYGDYRMFQSGENAMTGTWKKYVFN